MSQPQGTEVSLWWITGGLPGFVQDGGYSREEPGRPLTSSSPDSPSRKSLFIELGQGVAKRVWVTLECTDRAVIAMNIINFTQRRAPKCISVTERVMELEQRPKCSL